MEPMSSSSTSASICILERSSAIVKRLDEVALEPPTTLCPTSMFRSSTMPSMGEVMIAYWLISVSISSSDDLGGEQLGLG